MAGVGFTFSRKPALPLILNAHGSADFAVAFQASSPGGYRAALSSDGVSVLLTAAAVPGLSYEVQTASGIVALEEFRLWTSARSRWARRLRGTSW